MMTNLNFFCKLFVIAQKKRPDALNATQNSPALKSMVSEKVKKYLQILPFLAVLLKNGHFWRLFKIFSETVIW